MCIDSRQSMQLCPYHMGLMPRNNKVRQQLGAQLDNTHLGWTDLKQQVHLTGAHMSRQIMDVRYYSRNLGSLNF